VSTWVHAWLVLRKISKSSLLHVYHGNNVGHPFYPEPLAKPWHVSYPAILQALNQNPNLPQTLPSEENKEKKVPNQRIGRKQKEKIPNQRVGESKNTKERKFPIKDRKKTEEICRKVFRPNNIWTIRNCHHVNKRKKERKPRPKVILSLWLPTKILCVSGLFTSH